MCRAAVFGALAFGLLTAENGCGGGTVTVAGNTIGNKILEVDPIDCDGATLSSVEGDVATFTLTPSREPKPEEILAGHIKAFPKNSGKGIENTVAGETVTMQNWSTIALADISLQIYDSKALINKSHEDFCKTSFHGPAFAMSADQPSTPRIPNEVYALGASSMEPLDSSKFVSLHFLPLATIS